jgi:acyl carrier protein
MSSDLPAAECRGQAEVEKALAALWQEVLNTDTLPGPTDNFFSLGGDSIAMIAVELRIKEELSANIPEGAMLSTSSLRELSELISQNGECDGSWQGA